MKFYNTELLDWAVKHFANISGDYEELLCAIAKHQQALYPI